MVTKRLHLFIIDTFWNGHMNKDQHLRVIIIDDDPKDIKLLEAYLQHYNEIEVIGTYDNGAKSLEGIKKHSPDVVFLDIELPDMKGLELIESLDAQTLGKCRFVIYTAYIDYMLESFRNHAFDFLLKPICLDDLNGIIRRLLVAPMQQAAKSNGRIYVSERSMLMSINSSDYRLIHLQDIGILQYNSELRLWEAILAQSDKPVKLKRTVNSKKLLSLGEQFVQVNQKFIINIDCLYQVIDNRCEFYPPFHWVNYVHVGASFKRQLMSRFYSI